MTKKQILELLLKLEMQNVELNMTEKGFEWYYQLKDEILYEANGEVTIAG